MESRDFVFNKVATKYPKRKSVRIAVESFSKGKFAFGFHKYLSTRQKQIEINFAQRKASQEFYLLR